MLSHSHNFFWYLFIVYWLYKECPYYNIAGSVCVYYLFIICMCSQCSIGRDLSIDEINVILAGKIINGLLLFSFFVIVNIQPVSSQGEEEKVLALPFFSLRPNKEMCAYIHIIILYILLQPNLAYGTSMTDISLIGFACERSRARAKF